MKDVAELAGVSVSTVSRVLSGRIPVEKTTAERVQDAIASLNFRPNLLASGLRSKSGKLIGLVIPGLYEPFASIVGHLERYATRRGFSLLVGNSRALPHVEERFVNNLIQRHVDGIIFTPVSGETSAMGDLLDSDIPVVWFDRVCEDRRVLSVKLDNEKAGTMAARHFLEMGHRELAVVTGPEPVELVHSRLRGFVGEARSQGVEVRHTRIMEGDFSFESGVRLAQQFLSMPELPTAVWAQNDLMAIGLLKGFSAAGVDVPGSVSIIGMDGIPLTMMVHPELTTIRQPIQEMCKTVVSKVLEYRRYLENNQLNTVFEPELVVRGSVRSLI
ncbi:MAG: LacI family transcriptional regulator [Spirochaetaceae bacterium]|nr:MAG: LacI family transcriptional regulator [Spirochaetaceae bacterium]